MNSPFRIAKSIVKPKPPLKVDPGKYVIPTSWIFPPNPVDCNSGDKCQISVCTNLACQNMLYCRPCYVMIVRQRKIFEHIMTIPRNYQLQMNWKMVDGNLNRTGERLQKLL